MTESEGYNNTFRAVGYCECCDDNVEFDHPYTIEGFQEACKDLEMLQERDFDSAYLIDIYKTTQEDGSLTWSEQNIEGDVEQVYDKENEKWVWYRKSFDAHEGALDLRDDRDEGYKQVQKWEPDPDDVISSDDFEYAKSSDEEDNPYEHFTPKEIFNSVLKQMQTEKTHRFLKYSDMNQVYRWNFGGKLLSDMKNYTRLGLIKNLNDNQPYQSLKKKYARVKKNDLITKLIKIKSDGDGETSWGMNKIRWAKMDRDSERIFAERRRKEQNKFTDKELLEKAMQGYKKVIELNMKQQEIINEMRIMNETLIAQIEGVGGRLGQATENKI
jgi:hypothetical protein